MIDNWYFTRHDERQGPVPFERLVSMAKAGWLQRGDLVWRSGMADWTPAAEVPGLFRRSVADLAGRMLGGHSKIPAAIPDGGDDDARPPALPAKPRRRRTRPARSRSVVNAWQRVSPRQLVTAAGGFLTALGIAFTVIAHTRLTLALSLSGLFILAVGLAPEISRLLVQALDNIVAGMHQTARRQLRAEELALQKQLIDLEAAKLAQQDKALDRLLPAEPADCGPETRSTDMASET